jgi:hypothetical protein
MIDTRRWHSTLMTPIHLQCSTSDVVSPAGCPATEAPGDVAGSLDPSLMSAA